MNRSFPYDPYSFHGSPSWHAWPSHHAGLRFGVPGWRLGGSGGSGDGGTDWSTVAKIALVVGGALTVYAIYRASKVAEPIAERVGEVGTRYLIARGGGGGPALAQLPESSGKNGKTITLAPSEYSVKENGAAKAKRTTG